MEMNVFMQKLQIRQKTCYIEQNGSGDADHFMGNVSSSWK